jgi:hypothetical protein
MYPDAIDELEKAVSLLGRNETPVASLGKVLAGVYCECSPETLRIPSKSFRP